MTGRYKAYPEYKDSPIDWLDKIPANWETKRLKHLGQAIIGLTYSPNEVIEEKDEDSTLVLRSSNVQNQKIVFNDNVFVNKEISEKLTTRFNDILICSRNGSRALIGKNALIDANSTGMSFGAFMTIFRSEYNTYLSHVMNSKLFEYQSGSFLTSTINQLTTGNLNSFEIPFPSKNERNSIANFLDHETAKIDTLITKQEKLIELLKEKRQAVISHAVTKGLNPDTPMKDSGVEWLGEMPEHWEMKKLKYIGEAKNGLTYSPDNVVAESEGVLVLRSSNIQNASLSFNDNVYVNIDIPERIKTKKDDLLICSRNGSRKLIGKNALITEGAAGMAFGAFMVVYRSPINPYLFWIFNSPLFEYQSGSFLTSTINQLTISNLYSMEIPLPPSDEQETIKKYLVNKNQYFDALTAKSKLKVKLLVERKTALISAAVTGKIDVRDWSQI